ncbi:gem-associated protein 8-like [Bicyclus anynana]|uniref:Gem-associated protein 8-like n=1 Tax=Bicyclus anynana TaxID=110368 RepID=A0A6J1PBM2_BICAN|nr:gem-associated protein 8-like [Bicyclus anynana]
MSTWAQHFAEASTWQLKHQLAFWKARAISLQYENTMLHEVIRNNHLAVPTTSEVNREAESDSQGSDSESEEHEHETERNNIDYTENDSDNVEDENNEFEVSEEFIQFLTANAKYKEDARRERERLKAKSEAESKPVPKMQESVEDKISRSKELYGDKYKRIMALEMYLMSNFQNEADRNKATYWPNIPFNFNVS